ncbi:Outer membrane receptor proteins, mostly Fe transport [Sphingomonas laterariae]|uniref:Outer membrane receptor proteins, mostly Fe transport n=1 Tax=Edaphosphingomonas laterariae TaxID=861865 RepID=A0A239FPW1_9SPHN|nr:TonB-dependent receptor [Sphingomonas laterariae]SNS58825.1 Outer membrane receptor proteins, mostly Fe transport [Sphingomonas laterariae]
MRHLILTAFFLPSVAYADPGDIIVTGAGLTEPAGLAAYDVSLIDRDRLTRSASGRLEDVLRDVAGFQQFRRSDSRSAHPTTQGATLRGLGGNASARALILLDGVPQTDPFGGWLPWSAYQPERLGLVRVTRGGGSGVAGPGALAGTIELMSAGPDQLAPLWGGVAYGSRDSLAADAGLSGAFAGGYATLSGNYARGDGFTPVVKEDRGPVDRPAFYEQASLSARSAFAIGADTEFQASLLGLLDRRDRGVDFTPNRNIGADASVRLVGRGRWGWEASAWAQLREFSSGFASVNAARTEVNPTLDQYAVPATGLGARFEIRPPIGEGIELRIGADARQATGETRERYSFVAGAPTRLRQAGGRTRTLGGFAEASFTPDHAWTLTAGGRIDRWRIENGHLFEKTIATGATLTDDAFADRSGWEPTARGGIAFKPAQAVTLRSAAYLGWRLPSLNELYRPFRAGTDATAANALLKPERLKGVDAGFDYRPLPGFRLSATAFYNRLDNAIANVTLGNGPGLFPGVGFVAAGGAYRQRQNLDAVRSQGIELEAAARHGPWQLAASYTLIDAEVRGTGAAAALDGLRPAQTPRHQASATLAWLPANGAAASLTARHLSGQYEDDQNLRRLDDATTFDASFSLPVAAGFAIEARAENLADTRVEAGISGADIVERATPRTIWIGLRYGGR